MVVVCCRKHLKCDGVGEFWVLEEDVGLTGEGVGLYKMALKGVEWKIRMGKQKFLKWDGSMLGKGWVS